MMHEVVNILLMNLVRLFIVVLHNATYTLYDFM